LSTGSSASATAAGAAGRQLLVLDEVNAAIEGALAGGATEIVLNDSHANMRNFRAQAAGR